MLNLKTDKMNYTKKANKSKNFNITNYNEEQKEFFIGLGFTERRVKFMGEWMEGSLSFHGSKSFGFWNDDEAERIYKAIEQKYGKVKVRTLTTAELM
jgi:hypothetical protein